MKSKFKKVFSSISVKLFLSFWLITLVSISTTRIISNILTDNAIILPAHPKDLRHLDRVSQHVQTVQPENLQAFLHRSSPKNRHSSIWLKHIDNKVLLSRDKQRFPILTDYLSNNNLTEAITVKFKKLRLTGPNAITINNQDYQIYIATKDRFPGMHFRQLPPWILISIPLTISLLLCWLLARSLSKPIYIMKDAAKQFGEGNLALRVEKIDKRNDELGSLAKSFNQMAEQVELSVTAQKRLLGDVSHELRSPLTRLQLALGLAENSTANQEHLNKYLQRCEEEVSRLDEMLTEVLELSKLENALQVLNRTNFDLIRLIDIIIQDAQFMADQKDIIIEVKMLESFPVFADSKLISSAIANVLLNAVKYSPKESKIILKTELQDNCLLIQIVDAGHGVPEEVLSHLFEPFYRVAIARDRVTGGTGLGLAIAKQAVVAHQGSIDAANNKIQGLTVSIRLPLHIQNKKQ